MTARIYLRIILALWLFAAAVMWCNSHSFAQAPAERPSYEEYRQAASLVTGYFWALYQELGPQVRYSEILASCASKKEGDELRAHVFSLAKKKLDALIEEDIKRDKLRGIGQVLIAHEGTMSMLTGYSLGFKESWLLTSDSLSVRLRESTCNAALRKARESREQVPER